MRLLLASAYHLSAYYGGNEHFAHHLAQGLSRLGHQVIYLTGFAQKYTTNYQVKRLPVSSYFGKPFFSRSWITVARHYPCDLFHACGSGLPLIAAAYSFMSQHPRVPRLLTFQADSYPQNPLLKLAVTAESRLISASFPDIVTTTPAYQTRLQKRMSNNHVHRVPLFISDTFLRLAEKSKTIFPPHQKNLLFVGQLDHHHYYKGLPILIHSLKYLPTSVVLHVIGEGTAKKSYQDLAASIGVGDRCRFIGFVPHNQLPPYFRNAACFCLPSISASEGFGMVAIEAMAQKTPVVTTSIIGSASWFKRQRVASIVLPSNPRQLAVALKAAIFKPPPTQINRAYLFARNLSLNHMVQSYLSLYSTLIKHHDR